jgi:hypothetical protein
VAIQQVTNMSPEEIRDRLKQLREEWKEIPEPEQRSVEQGDRYDKLADEVFELDVGLRLTEAEERRSRVELAATHQVGGNLERRDIPGVMMGSEEFKGWSQRGANASQLGQYDEETSRTGGGMTGGPMSFEVDQRAFAQASRYPGEIDARYEQRAYGEFGGAGPGPNIPIGTGYDASSSGLLLPLGQPIPPVPRQARLYLRDLMPSMTTTLAQVPYVRELTPTAQEAATAVGEGGLKPQALLNFAGDKADPTVLAGTLVLSRQLFEDAPAVVSYVNSRLPYIVRFKEDNEFLNGSGNWPDIKGILNTTGFQTSAMVTDAVTSIGTAIGLVEMSDGVATGVVMNPVDAWSMFTHRASTSGVLDAGTPFAALPLTVWGVPSYRSRAYAQHTCMVADWQRGGMVVDRESVNIQIFRETYAASNQVLVVCEERVGVMWPRPDLFVQQALP